MNWDWHAETEPPPPCGVLGLGAAARRLWQRAQADDTAGAAWRIAAHADLLLIAGTADSLPWCEGALYVAPRAEAVELWLPTTQRPTAPLDLLLRAAQRRHGARSYLLLREPAQLVALDRLQAATSDSFAAIAAKWN